eukprot:CAMPEP_0201880494 /NCGR_PEP_ID=MMETSP0902-20130614/11057_1 /ASSEMBLY_ACC=CAM_ASM_000551 /TAXON_ID=420261 /ORGANISM="Thalassiosira antarctica, Strain CCMP982" /LENGTH=310 /DNA_ID=CAMNT_0048408505 /DNA_START=342 /DNA_END=1274 /DNA_ORIENTATION=+
MADLGAESQEGRAPIIAVSITHAGFVCPRKQIPHGIPTNFGLLQAAEKALFLSKEEEEEVSKNEYERRNKSLFGEVHYKAFYDDFTIHHEQEWAAFFQHPMNWIYLHGACWVLMKLADIYYCRPALEECGEVVDKLSETAELLKQHITATDYLKDHIHMYEKLKYQVNIFQCVWLKKETVDVPALRDICAYEVKYLYSSSLDSSEQPNLHVTWLGLTFPPHHTPTVEEIYALPEECMLKLAAIIESEMPPDGHYVYGKEVQLLVCGNCNKQETALGEFKLCQRCNKVAYCGRKCQKTSWKGHKKVCGKTG